MKLPDKCRLSAQAVLTGYDMLSMRDPKQLEHYVTSQLRRSLCAELLETGEVQTRHDLDTDRVTHRIDLLVFSPKEFHSVVLTEARRMMDEWMKGPSHGYGRTLY